MPKAKSEGATAVAVPVRRKVNRGSTRRINRAFENFEAAAAAFQEEIERQAWLADDKGERVADHPIVAGLKNYRAGLRADVGRLVNPEIEEPAEEKTE